MRLISLIAPAAMLAAVAVFAPHADAQTMGEYATTVGVATGASSSMGTSIDNSLSGGDLGGGSRTWGTSSLGASFSERAAAASGSGSGVGADFEARAGGGGDSNEASRWPTSEFGNSSTADRFGATDRFQDKDRFPTRELSSSDRFPPSAFNDNKMGLDTHYSSSSELDTNYSAH